MGLREQDTSALAGANSTSSPEEATPRFITQMENGRRVTYEQLDMFNSPPCGRLDIRLSVPGHIGSVEATRSCR